MHDLDELDILGAPVKGHLKGERLAGLVILDVGDLVIVGLYRSGNLGLGGAYRERDHVGDAHKRVIAERVVQDGPRAGRRRDADLDVIEAALVEYRAVNDDVVLALRVERAGGKGVLAAIVPRALPEVGLGAPRLWAQRHV